MKGPFCIVWANDASCRVGRCELRTYLSRRFTLFLTRHKDDEKNSPKTLHDPATGGIEQLEYILSQRDDIQKRLANLTAQALAGGVALNASMPRAR